MHPDPEDAASLPTGYRYIGRASESGLQISSVLATRYSTFKRFPESDCATFLLRSLKFRHKSVVQGWLVQDRSLLIKLQDGLQQKLRGALFFDKSSWILNKGAACGVC